MRYHWWGQSKIIHFKLTLCLVRRMKIISSRIRNTSRKSIQKLILVIWSEKWKSVVLEPRTKKMKMGLTYIYTKYYAT